VCKPCSAAYKREHYRENKSDINAKNSANYHQNRERYSQQKKEQYRANPEPARARARKRAEEKPEVVKEEQRRRYQENRTERLEKQRKYAAKYPDRVRDTHLRRLYGIDLARYEAMLQEQGGGCKICGAVQADAIGRRLHVDHCHETGRVRGLLCYSCNKVLGLVHDSTDRLERTVAYLRS
jgi:hypothetical protein